MNYGFVKSICMRYSKNNQEAEEMLNDTFYTAFKYLDRYDVAYEFNPWIKKVCVNCCLKYLKKYKSNFELVAIKDLDFVENNNTELNFSKDTDKLKLIKKLPPAYRAVFNLFVFEEYKHSEIADKLNISVGTSKSNLSRAKAILKKVILENKDLLNNKDKAYG